MMNNDTLSIILAMAIAILIFLVMILVFVYVFINSKEKRAKTNKNLANKESESNVATKSYNKQSIFKFMNFDKVEDNMIIQKKGKRFLMVVECQGINFDLMSGVEKNSVEQGFLQFLNTLRYTIQIYVQTKTVNLSSSINTYKQRVEVVHSQLIQKQNEYNQKVRSEKFDQSELIKEKYNLVRLKNLYEYGIDIVSNTEKMSLNKNILSKFYYIIIPYYLDETESINYGRNEIENLAFSELYTKAQSIINSLSVCGIKGKILDSEQIMELIYTAYNRDQSEALSLQKALSAGYDELYSTAPDVLDKRMKELDLKIEEKAVNKANDAVQSVFEENAKQQIVKEREKKLEELINQKAEELILQNKKSIGEDVAQKAINKISKKKTEEKEVEKDGKKTSGSRTRRVTKS